MSGSFPSFACHHAVRILVVDDEPGITDVLDAYLLQSGSAVTISNSAADALQQLREHRFDMVVTDFTMPSVDGGKIAEEAAIHSPEAKIILMTGNLLAVPDHVRILCDAVLEKPHILKGLLPLMALR